MKRFIYIFLFAFLGFIFQLLIHGLFEIWYIDRLINDFQKYSFGFSWPQWFLIHHIATIVLMTAGVLAGFVAGKFFWHKIYEINKK
jgi:hypothetical protein